MIFQDFCIQFPNSSKSTPLKMGTIIWTFPKTVGFPPKSSNLFSGFPLFSPSILGETPLFLETAIYFSNVRGGLSHWIATHQPSLRFAPGPRRTTLEPSQWKWRLGSSMVWLVVSRNPRCSFLHLLSFIRYFGRSCRYWIGFLNDIV